MKDPSDNIRQWLYNILNGTIFYNGLSVPAYSFPSKEDAMPYIVIAEQSMDAEEAIKDCYVTNNNVTLEIYTSFTGNDATYKVVNSISNAVLQLVRQRAIETHGSGGLSVAVITGFNPIGVKLKGSITDRIILENIIVIFKSLNINLLLEEL
jgi:hypothetical protein